jgi:hypothetical protein
MTAPLRHCLLLISLLLCILLIANVAADTSINSADVSESAESAQTCNAQNDGSCAGCNAGECEGSDTANATSDNTSQSATQQAVQQTDPAANSAASSQSATQQVISLPTYGHEHGVPQVLSVASLDVVMKYWTQQTQVYMDTVVAVDEKYKSVRDKCRNNHKDCLYWSFMDEVGTCECEDSFLY